MTFKEAWETAKNGDTLRSESVGIEFSKSRHAYWSFAMTPHRALDETWEVLPTPMDFATAMRHLQEGKTVGRRGWKHCLLVAPDCVHGVDMFSSENLKATDWEVIE